MNDKYTLVVVWNNTGERETHEYPTYKQALKAEKGFKRAFGFQVWTCIND